MSENPTQTQPAVPTARPATTEADEPYGAAVPAGVDREGTTHGLHWAPLLPRPVFIVVLTLGVVVGIAGPILLWLNLTYVNKETPFHQRVGYLLVLVGLGLLVIALPLLLGEAGRLERVSAIGSAEARLESRADHARGVTGTRMFALVGVVVLLAGVFLLRPVEPSDASTSGGSSQGGGGGNQGGGAGG